MRKGCFVFLDIDGTIYTPRLGVPDSTKEAIARLKKNGHHPVLCTGRTRVMIFPEILALGCEGIIAGVGSFAEWQGERLFDDTLPEEEINTLVKNFIRFGFEPFPEGSDNVYYEPEASKDPAMVLRRIFSLKEPKILRPVTDKPVKAAKVSGLILENSDVKGFKETLGGKYHGINHKGFLLETFPVGTTKGSGIKNLLRILKKEDAETFAYGDSFNDLEMLETAKHGVCMENGDPKLLARIPLHAGSMAEDGLYHSLKEFNLI